jgi:hypothetical protein
MARSPAQLSTGDRSDLVEKLIALHAPDESRSEVRHAILDVLSIEPGLIHQPAIAGFLAQEIQVEDLDLLTWERPSKVLDFYAALYAYNGDDPEVVSRLRRLAQHVLTEAFHTYEQAGNHDALLSLLRMAPAPPGVEPEELLHLRHLAHLRESQRVRRNRRWLYTYLIVQAFLVLIVFPLLFQNAENGAIQRQIEEAAGVELEDSGRRLFSYGSALYWTIITATSIGYGDIAPLTSVGRAIAAVLGTLGVITIGVVGGLVLRWITPRELP